MPLSRCFGRGAANDGADLALLWRMLGSTGIREQDSQRFVNPANALPSVERRLQRTVYVVSLHVSDVDDSSRTQIHDTIRMRKYIMYTS